MNQAFIADMTPARARLVTLMGRYCGAKIDQAVFDCATQGTVAEKDFLSFGIQDSTDREAIQFIIDMDYRCGIPSPDHMGRRRTRIIEAALGIGEKQALHLEALSQNSEHQFQTTDLDYSGLLPQRHKVAVLSLESETAINLPLLGKYFPRLILTGNLRTQLAFAFGSQYSSTTKMSETLYPSVNTNGLKRSGINKAAVLLSSGVYVGFLE